eukprot:TRINITY_DN7157_c0_g1_i1.p1 TRINITY_DN7157_c0_g1~~TRINITY_DN7157_c0_g1_i1.p1  ORF type:complete len:731 (+),score=200.79 TRINITY_DN7157_c0_g1_i1:88-2280(+)
MSDDAKHSKTFPSLLHVEKKKRRQEEPEEALGEEETDDLSTRKTFGESVPGVGRIVKKGSEYFSFFKNQKRNLESIRNSYQPQNVIGQNVFENGLYDEINGEVLNSKEVKEAIEELRMMNPNKPRGFAEAKAVAYIERLAAHYKETAMKGTAYVVQNILLQLYNGIHVSQKEIQRVKEAAAKAQQEGVSLVLLPTHKSHVDYLVMSYLFLMCDLSLPFIAAGDNLMMPIVGEMLRSSGAFFIRRKFDDDKLYRAIFDSYIRTILMKGYNMEFFIEGGRSRTGKLLPPKMGVLSILVEGCLSGSIKDAYLVPVSIGYDKVIETEQYVTELLGGTKEKESIGALIRSTQLLKFRFGRIDIRFAQPFSLKQYLADENAKRGNKRNSVRALTQVLAYSILYKINKVSVTLPPAILVSVMLTHRGRGISRPELIQKFEWLSDQIKKRGGKVATPDAAHNTGQLIDTTLKVIGSLITKQKNVLQPVFTPAKRFELAYYRNQILHLFMNEGLVACSLYSNLRLRTDVSVDQTRLLEDVAFISMLLKMEIIYLPSPDMKITFQQTLNEMKERGTIEIDSEGNVKIGEKEILQFDFLCALFWPFIDSYWLMCSSFYSLYPSNIAEERVYIQKVQSLGFTLYHQGELSFYESISKETLSNALRLFLQIGVIDKQMINETGASIIKLNRNYQDGDQKLVTLIERIGRMRREGKYSLHGSAFSQNLRQIARLTVATKGYSKL